MKKAIAVIIIVILCLFLFPTGMILDNKKSDAEVIISKAFSSKRMSILSMNLGRNVYVDKQLEYKLLNVKFVSAEDLLSNKITNFYSFVIKMTGDNASITINNYKSGMMYHFDYIKRNGKWKEAASDYGKVKFEPSKPYYIYLENMRKTNSTYKNYDIKLIPRDSLK